MLFFENSNAVPFYHIHLDGNQMAQVEQIYENIYNEYQLKQVGYEHIVFSHLMILLVLVLRLITCHDRYDSNNSYEKEIIRNAIRYIDEHYADPNLTLEDVASRAFLSKSYFGKLFRKYANQKFTTYVQNKRITAACELLISTDKKIIDIIEMVGYHDVKHFNEVFKRTIGKTPSEYRRSGREGAPFPIE